MNGSVSGGSKRDLHIQKPDAREAAFMSLDRCERQKRYSCIEVDTVIKKYRLEGAEKGLYAALVYGVTERLTTLDFFLRSLSKTALEKLDSGVLTALRLALYQIIFLTKIPHSAAVNESVKLTKKHISAAAGGYVNALLRNFLRALPDASASIPEVSKLVALPEFKERFAQLDKYGKLSVIYAFPPAMCEFLCNAYSDEQAIKIMESENAADYLTLKVNTLKTTVEAVTARLETLGLDPHPTAHAEDGIKFTHGAPIAALKELFDSGEIYVQDEASQLAVRALDPKPGETLLDACSCPGGKSFSAAIYMQNCGRLLSCDLHRNKLSLVESGAAKLGIGIITTLEADGSRFDEKIRRFAPGGFDRILCDVPCSGLGVAGKKPEIRYKDPGDISRLPEIQMKILENCSTYLKDGGVLVYSTCTLNPEENEHNIERFLAAHPEFAPCDFKLSRASDERYNSKRGMITLFPHIHETDGFFISKLVKCTSRDPEQ